MQRLYLEPCCFVEFYTFLFISVNILPGSRTRFIQSYRLDFLDSEIALPISELATMCPH